jgi:hypothetical protein
MGTKYCLSFIHVLILQLPTNISAGGHKVINVRMVIVRGFVICPEIVRLNVLDPG